MPGVGWQYRDGLQKITVQHHILIHCSTHWLLLQIPIGETQCMQIPVLHSFAGFEPVDTQYLAGAPCPAADDTAYAIARPELQYDSACSLLRAVRWASSSRALFKLRLWLALASMIRWRSRRGKEIWT